MINKSLAINYFQKNKQTVKLMFIVMLPILSQYFIEALITFVDNFFALKTEDRKISLNAIGQVNNIFLLFYFFALAISASAGIYFNQFLSQKNYQKNKEIVRLQLILAMPFVIFAAFILYFQSEKVLSFLFESDFSSKNEKLIKKATSFLKIIVFSYPFAVYSIIFYNVMYMSGYNRLPFFIALFSFFLKLTIFLFLFKLSVLSIEKIAIITLITRIFEFIWITLFLIIKNPFFNPGIKLFSFKLNFFWKNIKSLIPILIREELFAVAIIVQMSIMFRFGGENVFSATVINFTVMGIFYASFPACLVLVPVFISKYLGINQFEKAKENAKLLISFVSFIGLFITVLGLISSFFVNNIIKFTDKFDYGDNKLLIELTTYYIRFQSIAIAFQLLTQVIYAIVNSGNLVKLVLFLDLLSQWVIVILGIFILWKILSKIENYDKIESAKKIIIYLSLSEIFITIFAYLLYKKANWTKNLTDKKTFSIEYNKIAK